MGIFDRLRELHDDIVFRHFRSLRRLTPVVISALFAVILATTLGMVYFGDARAIAKTEAHADTDYPVLGATLRLSRISDRPARPTEASRTRIPEAEANDPLSPMLIDIDPESGAMHASAGSIDILGMPINIGSWPLD